MSDLTSFYTDKQEKEIEEYYKKWLYHNINNNLISYLNQIRYIRYATPLTLGKFKYDYDNFFKKHEDIIIQTHFDYYSFDDLDEEGFKYYYTTTNKLDKIIEMFVDYYMIFPTPDHVVNEYFESLEYDL